MQLSPPLLVNRADIDRAGLLGPGSRASYRLMFAGTPQAIADLRAWLKPRASEYRLVGIEDTQRGMRAAFDRAGRFLALSALLAVLLSGVATALAANRFAMRRIDTVAVLRCLGARQRDILAMLSLQLLLTAIPACLVGIGLGMLAQEGLVQALGSLIPNRLPLPQATPAWRAPASVWCCYWASGCRRCCGCAMCRRCACSTAALPRCRRAPCWSMPLR